MHNLTLIGKAVKSRFSVTLDNDMHLKGEYQIGLTDISLCTKFLVNMGRFEIEFKNNLDVDNIISRVKSKENIENDIKKCFNIEKLNRLLLELKGLDTGYLLADLNQLIADQKQLALGKFEIFVENNMNKDESLLYFQNKFADYLFIKISKTNDSKLKFEFNDPVVSVTLRANQPKNWINVDKDYFLKELPTITYIEIMTNIIEANKNVRSDQTLKRLNVKDENFSEYNFEHVQFHPINKTNLNTIPFEIRDQNKNLVFFKFISDIILSIVLKKNEFLCNTSK